MTRHVLVEALRKSQDPHHRPSQKSGRQYPNPNMRKVHVIRCLAIRACCLRSNLRDPKNRTRHSVQEYSDPDLLEPRKPASAGRALTLFRWTTQLLEKRGLGVLVRRNVVYEEEENGGEGEVFVYNLHGQEVLGATVRDDTEEREDAEDDRREENAHDLTLFGWVAVTEEVPEDVEQRDGERERCQAQSDPGDQVLESERSEDGDWCIGCGRCRTGHVAGMMEDTHFA